MTEPCRAACCTKTLAEFFDNDDYEARVPARVKAKRAKKRKREDQK